METINFNTPKYRIKKSRQHITDATKESLHNEAMVYYRQRATIFNQVHIIVSNLELYIAVRIA